MTGSDEGRDEPLVELVHCFQVHVVRQPHVLVHQVERSVSDELVQVPVIVLDTTRATTKWKI